IYYVVFFFFQAEDGIRDATVTGVQTCALPISLAEERFFKRQNHGELIHRRETTDALRSPRPHLRRDVIQHGNAGGSGGSGGTEEIGRASCRERVWRGGVGVRGKRKRRKKKAYA